jgi:hypothetical protein
MKKYLVASVGATGRLYFVPEGDKYDGVFIDSGVAAVVPIFSFIEKRRDVKPIKQTNRQKRFWKLDFNNPKWAKAHFVQLSSDSKANPYNEKAKTILNRLDGSISPKRSRTIE